MTELTRSRARRRQRQERRERASRRILLAAAGSGGLSALCFTAALLPVPGAAAGDVSTTLDAIAQSQPQGYTSVLVSGEAALGDRDELGVETLDPRDTARIKEITAQIAQERYGWGADQMACLDALWEKESNWNTFAVNPTSGAYGIPQSWPAEKLAEAGEDWRTNPIMQVEWGLEYIKQAYGDPCTVWSGYTNWY